MEESKIISGYLECDDIIMKISSFDDVQSFIAKYGKSVKEITEIELDALSEFDFRIFPKEQWITDDCNIIYIPNPLILLIGNAIPSYKTKKRTIAIANKAFSFKERTRSNVLNNIVLNDSLIIIGSYAFAYNSFLQSIIMSKTIIKIGGSAFKECRSLYSVALPDSLKYIGEKAFQKSGLKSIILPSKVREIGSYAFAYCDDLTTVCFNGIPTVLGSGIFEGCKSITEIRIPQGSIEYFVRELITIENDKFVEEVWGVF